MQQVICLDEFKKSNSNLSGKYALMLVNHDTRIIIDIIPNRRSNHFKAYLDKIPYEARIQVKTVVIDLWSPYRSIIKVYFPNTSIVADKFHFVRYITWAFNDVRIRVMSDFKTTYNEYKFLKRYWKILIRNPDKPISNFKILNVITNTYIESSQINDYATSIHGDIYEATIIKEYFYSGPKSNNYNDVLNFINGLLKMLHDSSLKEFRDIFKTFINWKDEIINAYIYKCSNGVYLRA